LIKEARFRDNGQGAVKCPFITEDKA